MVSVGAIIHFNESQIDPSHISALTNALYGYRNSSIKIDNRDTYAVGVKYSSEHTDANSIPRLVESVDRQAWILLVGRIDNSDELLKDSHINPSNAFESDRIAQCVLQGFLDKGEKWLNKLYGSFVFLIYIKAQKRLILCRDPMGDCMLYYLLTPAPLNTIIISSDESAITNAYSVLFPSKTSSSLKINKQKIAAYFVNQQEQTDSTSFKLIQQVPPAHYLDISAGRKKLVRYWSFPLNRAWRSCDHDDLIIEFRKKLNNAINRAVGSRSDLPILLSGGMDSSSLTALAHKHDIKLTAYSNVFDRFKECDERSYLNELYSAFELERVQVNSDTYLPLSGDPMQLHRNCNHIWVPPMTLQRRKLYSILQKDNHHCFLTGEYGDHLFAGYRYWLKDLLFSNIPITDKMTAVNHLLCNSTSQNKKSVLRRVLPLNGITSGFRRTLPTWLTEQAKQYLNDKTKESFGDSRFERDRYEYLFNTNSIELNSIVYSEAMHFGLKPLMPFKDPQLAEFVLNLPAYMFYDYRSNQHKYILRQAMIGLLPDIVRNRTQATVYNTMLRTSLMHVHKSVVHDILFNGDQQWTEFVRKEYVEHLISSTQIDDASLLLIWSCICYELWCMKVSELS